MQESPKSSTSFQQLEQAWKSAWRPPQKYKPSEWAERHFVLPTKGNSEPGKFQFSRTPYLRELVDAIAEPGIEDVVFMKATRVGGTTAAQIILGYWIDNDPGNCLTVMPTEDAAAEEIKDRVRPLLECPALKVHVDSDPHKNTLSRIELDTMDIFTGWAGAPQSLASRTCRYARFDEVDKYPPYSGRESDPISLGKERTGSYLHRKRHYITSTPTTRDGAIHRNFETCGDKRYFHVPCPHCGKHQRLVWSQVKWPKLAEPDKIKKADEIELSKLAWYECSHCKGRIEDSHKPKMLEAGRWLGDGQTINDDGAIVGESPKSKRVGFHLSSLYSPWRTFAEMAAEFIRAEGDIALTMNFRNSRLAEPFETQIANTDAELIRRKKKVSGAVNVVPQFAINLFATADVQMDRLYYVIRAWGYGFKSAMVRCGVVLGFDELWHEIFERPCVFENGAHVNPEILMIDTQYRTAEVMEFQKRNIRSILRSRGLPHYNVPLSTYSVEQGGLPVLNINTLLSKDRLNHMLNDGDESRWLPHSEVDDDYCSQMASEHRIWDAKQKREIWKQKTGGRDNHYWDCEANQCALAAHRHLDIPMPEEVQKSAQPERISGQDWMSKTKRW